MRIDELVPEKSEASTTFRFTFLSGRYKEAKSEGVIYDSPILPLNDRLAGSIYLL